MDLDNRDCSTTCSAIVDAQCGPFSFNLVSLPVCPVSKFFVPTYESYLAGSAKVIGFSLVLLALKDDLEPGMFPQRCVARKFIMVFSH